MRMRTIARLARAPVERRGLTAWSNQEEIASSSAVAILAGIIGIVATRKPRVSGPNQTARVWSSEVREISTFFKCPCGNCDLVLDNCTCDNVKGAYEVKDFINSLLTQEVSGSEIIEQVDLKYGHRL